MSGVNIAWYKLTQHAALTDVVPAARIQPDELPQGTLLPAISLEEISDVELLQVAKPSGLHTTRVQVTVLAQGMKQTRQVLALCRAALPYTRGTVNGMKCDSILPGTVGPDGYDDLLKSRRKSQDYIVTWSE